MPLIANKPTRDENLWRGFLKCPSERRHEALWNHYQPLVRHIAERFNAKMAGTFDPIQLVDAGNVGLLDAIAAYEPKTGTRFEAHAVPIIQSAISRSLAVQRAKEKGHVLRLELAEAISHTQAEQNPELPVGVALVALGSRIRRPKK